MQIPIYQVDAFTSRLFSGNPAAVCPLEQWLDDDTLQAIAAETNLSDTAFFIPDGQQYRIRWFTPQAEVDLCGHATLASAYVVFRHLRPEAKSVRFEANACTMQVQRDGEQLTMSLPSRPPQPCEPPVDLLNGLGAPASQILRARGYMAVYASQEEVAAIKPDLRSLARLDSLGVIVTAPGRSSDFVSRFFAPQVGIPEDPVCGSAHCTLVPYWAERLGKTALHARQISRRGGEIHCRLEGDRVLLTSQCAQFMQGTIEL